MTPHCACCAVTLFATLHGCYTFAHRVGEGQAVPLWPSVRQELRALLALLPLLYATLELPWSGEVKAVDASCRGFGIWEVSLGHEACAEVGPPTSRTPLPRIVLMAIAEQLVLAHKTAEALCCIMMFESYAQPAEAVALKMGCITAPLKGTWGALAATSLVIRSRELAVPSKTSLLAVSVALDLPRQAWVGRALSGLARSRPNDAHFGNFDHYSLGRSFVGAAEAAWMAALQACLYILYHGGASRDRATSCRSLAAVQLRGGWKSFESVPRYEKHALLGWELQRLWTAQRRISPAVRHIGGLVCRLLRQARRRSRRPERQAWLLLSDARSFWATELGRSGMPAVFLGETRGRFVLERLRVRDGLSGWLKSR